MERTPAAGKPVDPATRLSELLAQSLEELTRPFDPPRPGGNPVRAADEEAAAPADVAAAAGEPVAAETPAVESNPEESRMDADKALAELEAELFAAAKQVDSESAAHGEEPGDHAADHADVPHEPHDLDAAAPLDAVPPPLAPSEPAPEINADAASVIAKVRRLMLVSMAVTVIAVGSVFGFIGYRVYQNGGSIEKKADKLPEASPVPADVTLSLPRGARIVQSAVSNDRLVMTLDIDGKLEVRTFDVRTLQPSGRLNFSATP